MKKNYHFKKVKMTSEYRNWLRDLKQQIKTGQIKAALSVNSQMIMLYWDLGRQIVDKQETAQWGSGFIEQLSKDLTQSVRIASLGRKGTVSPSCIPLGMQPITYLKAI